MPLRRARQGLLIALLLLGIGALYFFIFTTTGQRLRADPRALGDHFHHLVALHPFVAPLLMILAYILLTSLMAPVWWVQVLAGYAFGLTWGTVYSVLAATCGAVVAFSISRFVAADLYHERIEAHLVRLRRIGDTLGNNGLLVVMVVRLLHFLPFGISNYIFGLISIRWVDVAIGTALGAIPSIMIPVAAGADPQMLKLSNARFWLPLMTLNVILLVPPLLRYWVQRRERQRLSAPTCPPPVDESRG